MIIDDARYRNKEFQKNFSEEIDAAIEMNPNVGKAPSPVSSQSTPITINNSGTGSVVQLSGGGNNINNVI